jgi:hypothetical protein
VRGARSSRLASPSVSESPLNPDQVWGQHQRREVLETRLALSWQNQTGRIHVRRRSSPEELSASERNRRMNMAVNHKLTHVVKDRVVQNFQLNASELLFSFVGGSTMNVKIVESNSPPLREGARIRRISEDQAKLVIECEDDTTIDVTIAEATRTG